MIRPVTIGDHERFWNELAPPLRFDEIDELAADPIVERIPRRSEAEQRRLFSILDELESEGRP